MNQSKWTFDPAKGVAVSRELSALMLCHAEITSGVRAQDIQMLNYKPGDIVDDYSSGTLIKRQLWEFANSQIYTGLLEDIEDVSHPIIQVLIKSLAERLVEVNGWTILPEIRAGIPTNLGKERIIAWYGSGLGSALISIPTPETNITWLPCPMEYRSGKHTCCPKCDGKGKVLA